MGKKNLKESELKPSSKIKISSIVIAVLAVLFVISIASGGFSKWGFSDKQAIADQIIKALNEKVLQGQATAVLNSVEESEGLYILNFTIGGNEYTSYTTKDGKLLFPEAIDLSAAPKQSATTNAPTTVVPKTDNPNVDLYVFSYCPYGTQTEKGFIPVYNLLKNKANLNIVFIGAMHGPHEEAESLRQLCINKLYGKAQFMNYIMQFDSDASIGTCGSDQTCSKPIANAIIKSLGMDSSKVDSCIKTDAPALYSADEAKAQSLGVSGSPTLIINGVETQSGRSPAALLTTICSAFTNAPAECSQTLDAATPSAGFGGSSSTATTSAGNC